MRWVLLAALVYAAVFVPSTAFADGRGQHQPDFGPNVTIFDPSMPIAQIQATVDAIASQQIGNQFGTQRYALLFKPGTYGTANTPLNFQVGYYTTVAGLGLSPNDVIINGSINVYNQCDATNRCVALTNFWRSLENLTINVNNPPDCKHGEFWAVSQAAPMRRVHVDGLVTLMDYCTAPSFASGGFIADSDFTGGTVVNGSQQQWITRNSVLDGWTNGVWNQVFSGVTGAPAQCFPAQSACGGPYTTIAASPITREAPFLYVDNRGQYSVFVPGVQRNTSGTSWAAGPGPGRSIPLDEFFIAQPGDGARPIDEALSRGKNVLLTPGVYQVDRTLRVEREGTIVLGLGIPTLVPRRGNIVMSVDDARGVDIEGVLFDAGVVNSPTLLEVGHRGDDHDRGDRDGARKNSNMPNPGVLHDVFFRVGGPHVGKATVSLEVNSDNVVLDDIWAWRADHGVAGSVGWDVNTGATGVVVNGDNVTATGLFVEHYQKYNVIWSGEHGRTIFFQNELPYDPPDQAAWLSGS